MKKLGAELKRHALTAMRLFQVLCKHKKLI